MQPSNLQKAPAAPADEQDLPEARSVFVKYTFVPGFGFCDIGLVHILANTMPVARGTVIVSGNRIAVEVKRILPRSPETTRD